MVCKQDFSFVSSVTKSPSHWAEATHAEETINLQQHWERLQLCRVHQQIYKNWGSKAIFNGCNRGGVQLLFWLLSFLLAFPGMLCCLPPAHTPCPQLTTRVSCAAFKHFNSRELNKGKVLRWQQLTGDTAGGSSHGFLNIHTNCSSFKILLAAFMLVQAASGEHRQQHPARQALEKIPPLLSMLPYPKCWGFPLCKKAELPISPAERGNLKHLHP